MRERTLEKWLYLATHPGSWGDTLFGFRQLKALKQAYPNSVLYVAKIAYDTWLTAPVLLSEGIVDNIVSMPDNVVLSSNALSDYLNDQFSLETFDRLILGCVYNPPIDEIVAKTKSLQHCQYFYAEAIYEYYTTTIKSKLPLRTIRDELQLNESQEYYQAWTINESVESIWKNIDQTKPTITIFPISTRKFSSITKVGLSRLSETFKDQYNLIVLGALGRFYRDCIPTWLFEALDEYGYYNWLGLSPLKQLATIRRGILNIIVPGGAITWPLLYNIKTVCIQGGEFSAGHWFKFNPNFINISVECDLFPCNIANGNPRYDKCKESPMCLNIEDHVITKIREVLEAK